jgi:hypothetical protein
VLPAVLTALLMGEPARHREATTRKGLGEVWDLITGPFAEFFRAMARCWCWPSSWSTRSAIRWPT